MIRFKNFKFNYFEVRFKVFPSRNFNVTFLQREIKTPNVLQQTFLNELFATFPDSRAKMFTYLSLGFFLFCIKMFSQAWLWKWRESSKIKAVSKRYWHPKPSTSIEWFFLPLVVAKERNLVFLYFVVFSQYVLKVF